MVAKADVLIITATEVESRAVLAVFQGATGRDFIPEPGPDGLYLDLGEIQGARIFMALSGIGSGGLGGSQESVRKGIDALSPSTVIMVGIAFGINEVKQRIGDVLISEQLMLYDLQQRVGTDKEGHPEIVLRGDRPPATPSVVDRLKVASLAWAESRVSVGLILSGDKLVDNIDFRTQLLKFEPSAIGGEMEGAGLYVACQGRRVDWALVKAICDWADGLKAVDKDDRQKLAAHNAAAFVLHALQQAPFKPDRDPLMGAADRVRASMATEPHEPVHSSLPSQPFFFGREKELGIIAEAISPQVRTWGALIDGPGGIGKTALAIRAGHLAPTADFERKIFLSAKVREMTPAGQQALEDFMLPNYMDLLAELARELGEDGIVHANPNERASAVRRALADVRALIIIDNVETLAEPERVRLYQFLSLLPEGCKAIVTSRRRSDIDARVIRLDRMERDDVLALLAELAKSNRHLRKATEQERGELYEFTNGNPLIIRWMIGQLGREGSQCRTIGDARAFLDTAPEANDPLEFVFGDLLDTFTASETSVLAALAHFTQPARVKWIAAIAAIAQEAARTALEDLTDRALLVGDQEGQTFLLPTLAGKFLRRRRPSAVLQTGVRLTVRAEALVLENGGRQFDRFPTLESEWPTIAAALPLLNGDNKRLQRVCSALDTFLEYSGRWDEFLSLMQRAEQEAVNAGDLWNAGWRAYGLGLMEFFRGRAAEVLACAERCEAHWGGAPRAGEWEKALALRLRGVWFEMQENYSLAAEAFAESLAIRRTIDPESGDVGIVLIDLGDAETHQGEWPAAELHYREGLRIAEKSQELARQAIAKGCLSELELHRGNWPNAERLAREALDLAVAVGDVGNTGCALSYLASALAGQGNPEGGLPYARQAIEILARLRMPRELEKAKNALTTCGG